MKHRRLVVGLACALAATATACDEGTIEEDIETQTQQARRTRRSRLPPYYLTSTGEVQTPRTRYASLSEFYLSEEFRSLGRCGTHVRGGPGGPGTITGLGGTGPGGTPGREPARGPGSISGGGDPLAFPSDCTLYATSPLDEYYLDDQDLELIVPVVVHNIMRQDKTGFLTNDQIHSQIEILNEDFATLEGTPGDGGPAAQNTHVRFVIAGIRRVKDDDWFDWPETYEQQYKTALAWDVDEYLNLYTVGIPESGALGWAYYPQDTAGVTEYDGVVLQYGVVGRDGENPPYDMGRTATHEVGHYLGLHHTFEPNDDDNTGTCENGFNVGDAVQDTIEQGGPEYGCPGTSNTCGYNVAAGMSNIPNYMNYTDDGCMSRFTVQQAIRSVCGVVNYRPGLYWGIPQDYDIYSGVETGSNVRLTKVPSPAGTTVRLSAMPIVHWPYGEPPDDLRITARWIEVPSDDYSLDNWTVIGPVQSNGNAPAILEFELPARGHIGWSISKVGGGSIAHTYHGTYLNCQEPDVFGPQIDDDIPECQP